MNNRMRCVNENKLHLDGIETLENRRLLAGNVNMVVNLAGDLILTGDAQANHIEISMEVQDGEFVGVVRGQQGTMIRLNGASASQHIFDLKQGENDPMMETRTTVRDVRVNLRGGDDRLEIAPWQGAVSIAMNVGRNLLVNMGSGNDEFEYAGTGGTTINHGGFLIFRPESYIFGETRILSQSGDDLVDVSGLTLFDSFFVNAGSAISANPFALDSGDQIRMVDMFTFSDVDIRGGPKATSVMIDGFSADGGLDIRTGSGLDIVTLADIQISADTLVDLGSVRSIPFVAPELLSMGDARLVGNLDIRGTGGSQFVRWSPKALGFEIAGTTDIRLGGGSDRVELSDSGLKMFAGDVSAAMGAGDDTFAWESSTFMQADMELSLGSGQDSVMVAGFPLVSGMVTIHGNAGFDTTHDHDQLVVGGELSLVSIEDITT